MDAMLYGLALKAVGYSVNTVSFMPNLGKYMTHISLLHKLCMQTIQNVYVHCYVIYLR